jgi:hypothetical protein
MQIILSKLLPNIAVLISEQRKSYSKFAEAIDEKDSYTLTLATGRS